MKAAIIFNHPYEGSYCSAILQSVTTGLNKAGHTVDLFHLDNDEFDPVMRANEYKQSLGCRMEICHEMSAFFTPKIDNVQ